eukprot:5798330-Pyramimonas_sp.AAC.1
MDSPPTAANPPPTAMDSPPRGHGFSSYGHGFSPYGGKFAEPPLEVQERSGNAAGTDPSLLVKGKLWR